MSSFFNAIGWKYLSSGDLFFIFVMASGVFMILAWVADLLMQRLSFGIIMNMALMMVGAVLGLAIMIWLGYPPTRKEFIPAIFGSGITSMVLLIVLASFKRAA